MKIRTQDIPAVIVGGVAAVLMLLLTVAACGALVGLFIGAAIRVIGWVS